MCKNNVHGVKTLKIPPHSHTRVTVKFNTTKAIYLGYTAHYYIVHFLPVDISSTMCQQSMTPFVGIIDLFQAPQTFQMPVVFQLQLMKYLHHLLTLPPRSGSHLPTSSLSFRGHTAVTGKLPFHSLLSSARADAVTSKLVVSSVACCILLLCE